MDLVIPYRPHSPKQWEFHKNCEQYEVSLAVTGTGFGKTFALVNQVALDAIKNTDWADVLPYLVILVAPTYRLLSTVHWPLLLNYIPEEIIESTDKTNRRIILKGNSEIMLMSITREDDVDKMRSLRPNIVAIDEARLIPRYAFDLAINRVAFRQGKVYVTTTPFGFDWSYDIEQMASVNPDKIGVLKAASIDNPEFSKEAIDSSKTYMDERLWRQEYLGTRETYGGSVYDFDRTKNCIKDDEFKFDPHADIHWFMDFNVNPMAGGFAQIVEKNGVEKVYVFDEYTIFSSNVEEVCREGCERYSKFFRIRKDPGTETKRVKNLWIYPDPSGAFMQHGGYSNISIIKGYFRELFGAEVEIRHRRKAPRVMDRINAVRAKLKNANNERNLIILDKCDKIKESLEQTEFKEGTYQINKSQVYMINNQKVIGREHHSDGLGYFIEYRYPVQKAEVKVL